MDKKVYYFDNAASSWPKPESVMRAMQSCMADYGANPGRGAHRMAVRASRALFEARMNLSRLFGVSNPNDICFTLNTTGALNLAIKGFVREGDHIVTTALEHNSVRRPLEYVKRTRNAEIAYVGTNAKGTLHIDTLKDAIRPNTRLMVVNHSSNLLGSILPVESIAELCREHGIKLMVDAAQTAGTIPIDVAAMGIDMLAFPGHKGLLGPQGTGGLYLSPEIELEPLLHGGTGGQSETPDQPNVRPDRYEAGTPNTVGIAGLNEGVKYVLSETVQKIHQREWELTQRMMEGLLEIEGVGLLGPYLGENKTGIVSFTLEGIDSSEAAFVLDRSFGIAVRSGYHCTPLAHQTAATESTGAIRASVGWATTIEEADTFIDAIRQIRQQYPV